MKIKYATLRLTTLLFRSTDVNLWASMRERIINRTGTSVQHLRWLPGNLTAATGLRGGSQRTQLFILQQLTVVVHHRQPSSLISNTRHTHTLTHTEAIRPAIITKSAASPHTLSQTHFIAPNSRRWHPLRLCNFQFKLLLLTDPTQSGERCSTATVRRPRCRKMSSL